MEIVLLIIFVGKPGHEVRRRLRSLQLLCQGPQGRGAHANDQFLGNRGDQPGLKIPVARIL